MVIKSTQISAFSISIMLIAMLLITFNVFAQKNDTYDAFVGTWDGTADYQGAPFYFNFNFTVENDSLKCSWAMDMGTFSIDYIECKKIEDSENYELTGTIEMAMGDQYFSLYLSGFLEKEKMSGTFGSEMGNSSFTATKVKPKKEDQLFR